MKRPIIDILAELRETEEHAQLEAKKGLGDSALETVSAFSNEPGLGGGTILFGVVKKDGQYEVVGVPSPETLNAVHRCPGVGATWVLISRRVAYDCRG